MIAKSLQKPKPYYFFLITKANFFKNMRKEKECLLRECVEKYFPSNISLF